MTKQNKKSVQEQASTQQPTIDPKIGELESRISLLESNLARAMADYQNLEKRYERESKTVIAFANASLLEKLLEIHDHLAAAAAHLQDPSVTMILSSVDRLLKDEGLVEIDCTGGYDPQVMECQEIVPGEKDKVVSVVRTGYKLRDRVLRTARVTVGNGQTVGFSKDSPAKKASETSV